MARRKNAQRLRSEAECTERLQRSPCGLRAPLSVARTVLQSHHEQTWRPARGADPAGAKYPPRNEDPLNIALFPPARTARVRDAATKRTVDKQCVRATWIVTRAGTSRASSLRFFAKVRLAFERYVPHAIPPG